MLKRLSVIVMLLASGACSVVMAQPLKEPPLPTALLTAKTIYLVNDGVHPNILKNTVQAIQKWGRFTIVANQQESDVTMTLAAQPPKFVYNWALGRSTPVNLSFLAITSTKDGIALYGVPFRVNPDDELKTLRKRLDTQPTTPTAASPESKTK